MSTHSENYDWHRALEPIRKRAVTSRLLGIGPAKQCAEIPIEHIWQLDISNEPLADHGPICPRQWAIIRSYHMTRGAESTCALACNLFTDPLSKLARWGSSIVLRCLGDAPLQTLTSTYPRHRQLVASRLQSAIPAILEQSAQPSSDLLEDVAEESSYAYLQHLGTKRIHLILVADLEFGRCEHLVTLCSWTANLSTTAFFDACPPGTMCKDCTRAAARQASKK